MSREKLRCWEGCIALTDSGTDRKNAGMVVKVLYRAPRGAFEAGGIRWPADNTPSWVIESQGRLFDQGKGFNPSKLSCYHDTALIPLSPPDGAPDESEDIDQPEQVAA